jgi:ADP-ribosylglycohydrolase
MYEALKYIPKNGELHKELTWALSIKDDVLDYRVANDLVTKRYEGMSWVHAINNACLTVWGIYLGKDNYQKGISETVAMAYDNDCTGATVGSVLGAYLGIDAIDSKWYKPWNNRVLSYLIGIEEFQLDDIIGRFSKIANIE